MNSKDNIHQAQLKINKLYEADQKPQAFELSLKFINSYPDRMDALKFCADLALELGKYSKAVELFQRLAQRYSESAGVLNSLAIALIRTGNAEDALKVLARVESLASEHLHVVEHNRGDAYYSLKNYTEAIYRYSASLKILPDQIEVMQKLGQACYQLDRKAEAKQYWQRVVELKPEWADVYSDLSNLELRHGDAKALLEVSEKWLSYCPVDIEALSLKAFALHELNRKQEFCELVNFDRFVKIIDLNETTGELNQELVNHIHAHPSLKLPPKDDPTYHHPALYITDELLIGDKGPMEVLEKIILREINNYRQQIAQEPPHPFLQHWPDRWKLASWAVVLKGEGNLVPHIHFDGYLGGVYYPYLPHGLREPKVKDRAGWFELGRPPDDFPITVPPTTRSVQPKVGRMILFPSYLYHCTIPFESNEERISIAFDLVPL